jgi:ribosomal protein S18 acetylase RimI-like enzyme
MTDAFQIREARPEDSAALSAFGWRTFTDTFLEDLGCTYPDEDLKAFFDDAYTPETFADWIASPDYGVWVGERGGELVGYAVTGPCSFPHPDATEQAGELKRLYVAREGQGRGLAPALLKAALDRLATQGRAPVWLSVWSGNLRAQAFYAKHGFSKAGEYEFPVGNSRDHEFLFRRG